MPKKIAEDVYKISSNGNVYLYLKPEVFVIDCSDNEFKESIKQEIEKITPISNVKKVLLTHLHYDHCGNLDLFINAEVYASKDDLNDFKINPDLFFLSNLSKESQNLLKKAKPLPLEINDLKVLNVVGHTKGSVAFIDKKRKILFSGDTLFKNGIGRTDFPNSIPKKIDSSVKLLKKILKEKDLKLCAGHDY